jgi:molecular chaperone GrpE
LTEGKKKERAEEQEEKEEEQEEKEAEEAEKVDVESLKKGLDEKGALADEYLSHLKYLQADFENYKKIVAREREQYEKCATEGLLKNLLPIIDNLECALGAADKCEDKSSFVEGTELIYKDLMATLAKEGLKPIKAVGEKFDPYKHEVMMTVIDDKYPEDTVLEEFEKGYMLGSKVLRTSKVKISKTEPPVVTSPDQDAG